MIERLSFKSPMHEMTQTTSTCLWNDFAAFEEPVIVLDVLKQEMHLWKARILELVREQPVATEREIAWALVEEISATRAGMLKHTFDAYEGRNGRLSIQTIRFFTGTRLR
jgi:transaldolase